jgi:hypothetical protein
MAEGQKYVRCLNAFFVKDRGPLGGAGIVNPGEIVTLLRGEAMDVVSANRAEYVTQQEAKEGPMADFKPKDGEGNVIKPVTLTRAQQHAAFREQMKRQQDAANAEQQARISAGLNAAANAKSKGAEARA